MSRAKTKIAGIMYVNLGLALIFTSLILTVLGIWMLFFMTIEDTVIIYFVPAFLLQLSGFILILLGKKGV